MEDDEIAQRFEQHRPHLHEVAHRLLGSRADAEDAVQDCWFRLQRGDVSEIENLGGWLTTVTSRICLDRLRARRTRPETFLDGPGLDGPSSEDPASDAVIADSVGRALVVVLDTLSPAERVAFLLHDVFAVPFDQIAPILERSTEATKKLASRARRRAQLGAAAEPHDIDGRREVIGRFLDALRRADMEAMLAVLAPDATRRVDPILLAAGQPTTVHSARSIADEARTLSAPAHEAQHATIDGLPAAVAARAGKVTLALTFVIRHGLIEAFEVIADPERLAGLSIDHDT